MGNGTEDDYNFVFKGKLGFPKERGSLGEASRGSPSCWFVAVVCFFLISYQDPLGFMVGLYKKESCKDRGGSGSLAKVFRLPGCPRAVNNEWCCSLIVPS